ncbi:hypothetical protein GVAV_000346 [Gurleya vavrai]
MLITFFGVLNIFCKPEFEIPYNVNVLIKAGSFLQRDYPQKSKIYTLFDHVYTQLYPIKLKNINDPDCNRNDIIYLLDVYSGLKSNHLDVYLVRWFLNQYKMFLVKRMGKEPCFDVQQFLIGEQSFMISRFVEVLCSMTTKRRILSKFVNEFYESVYEIKQGYKQDDEYDNFKLYVDVILYFLKKIKKVVKELSKKDNEDLKMSNEDYYIKLPEKYIPINGQEYFYDSKKYDYLKSQTSKFINNEKKYSNENFDQYYVKKNYMNQDYENYFSDSSCLDSKVFSNGNKQNQYSKKKSASNISDKREAMNEKFNYAVCENEKYPDGYSSFKKTKQTKDKKNIKDYDTSTSFYFERLPRVSYYKQSYKPGKYDKKKYKYSSDSDCLSSKEI